jgi:hypothetical protein
LYWRGSSFVISPGHGCTDLNVSWFFTVPSVRIVPQILSWPLQYYSHFLLDQSSYVVLGTNSIIKCSINTRLCPHTTVCNEIQTSLDENQILPIELIHKNGRAGEFIELESAIVEWFNRYWWCKIGELMF